MKIEKMILLFIFIIILFIIYEIVRLNTMKKCPKPYIEYRYVPRSFKEEQNERVPIEDIFNKMFAYPSPWMISKGIGITDKRDTGLGGRKLKV
jgi:hypothetical protein